MNSSPFNAAVLSPNWRQSLFAEGYVAQNCGALSDLDLLQVAVSVASSHSNLVVSPIALVAHSPTSHYITLKRGEVPVHTDGMYLNELPRYVLLYCAKQALTGGDTVLISGEELVGRMDRPLRTRLTQQAIEIQLAGRTQVRPLVIPHPENGRHTLTFVDPAIDSGCALKVAGRAVDAETLECIRNLIATAPAAHRQAWREGDLLVFDNLTFLHGRAAYTGDRCLKRIMIASNKAGI